MAELLGAFFGTAAFNVLAFAITKPWWPMSVTKIFVLSIIMIVVLSVGDAAVRSEPAINSFVRVAVPQIVILIYLLVKFQISRSKKEASAS